MSILGSTKTIKRLGGVFCAMIIGCALAFAVPVRQDSGSQSNAASTSKKASTAKSTAGNSSSATKARATKSGSGNKSSGAKTSSKKRSSKKKSAKVRGQQKIDPDRAGQIQQALVREHYLNEDQAAGGWNQASEQAMRKFQADHGWQSKTVPDSRALITLGLGPSKDHWLNPESAMTTVPDRPKSQSIPATSNSAPATATPLPATSSPTPPASDPPSPQ